MFKGWRALLVIGLAIVIIRPIALLPSLLPHISFYMAVKQLSEVEEGSEHQLNEEKQLYEKYLEENYGDSFILGETEFDSTDNHYYFEAIPESDKCEHSNTAWNKGSCLSENNQLIGFKESIKK
ncbi:hypothetical protein [Ornithinibacillus scapharcae]|uniref:hypothetical protein n=1 Tax=Ornithinibacillus scapharcae TaxID=1147159 RepID=UPI000225B3F1|nr:hypothetical protein [Ornithinibacillus scapharcae]